MRTTRGHEVAGDGDTSAPRKPVLHCPACGHTAHAVDGDWAITERSVGGARRRAYECPECWRTVVVQPVFAEPVPA